jgi:hypothetical protein
MQLFIIITTTVTTIGSKSGCECVQPKQITRQKDEKLEQLLKTTIIIIRSLSAEQLIITHIARPIQ